MESTNHPRETVTVPLEQWQVIVEVIGALCADPIPGPERLARMIRDGALDDETYRLFNNQLHFRLVFEQRGVSLLFGPPKKPRERPVCKIWPPEREDDVMD